MDKHCLLKIAVFIITIGIAPSVTAQNVYESPALKTQIAKLDHAHAVAIFEGNAASLDSLVSVDMTVNHPTGRIVKEKKELLDLIKKGTIKYTAFERTPEQFLFYKDIVIVMGSEIVVPASGAPNANKRLNRRYTNIWMKQQNGKWQLAVRHANNVCADQ